MRTYSDLAGSMTSQGTPLACTDSSRLRIVCDFPRTGCPAYEGVPVQGVGGHLHVPRRPQAAVQHRAKADRAVRLRS